MGCFDVYCAHCGGPFSVPTDFEMHDEFVWMEYIIIDGSVCRINYNGSGSFFKIEDIYEETVVKDNNTDTYHASCTHEAHVPQLYNLYHGQFFNWDLLYLNLSKRPPRAHHGVSQYEHEPLCQKAGAINNYKYYKTIEKYTYKQYDYVVYKGPRGKYIRMLNDETAKICYKLVSQLRKVRNNR